MDLTIHEIKAANYRLFHATCWQSFFRKEPDFNGKEMSLYSRIIKTITEFDEKLGSVACPGLKYAQSMRKQINKVSTQYFKDNPPPKNQFDVKNVISKIFKDFKDVIIVPSDKNLGPVALLIEDYNFLVNQHLDNLENFEPLLKRDYNSKHFDFIKIKFNSTKEFIKFKPEILEETTILHKRILKNLYPFKSKARNLVEKYFDSFEEKSFKLPHFKVLPKLHKKYEKLPSTRPLTAATRAFTTPTSVILDMELQPKMLNYPAILKNTLSLTQYIKEWNNNLPTINSPILMFSIDVVNLYPSIDLDKLYSILNNINPLYKDMAKFICGNNYVTYNDHVYLQKKGLATGTNCAVPLANLFLAETLDPLLINEKIQTFRRYIDDIFGIWKGTEAEFIEFFNLLNEASPIPLTYTIGKEIVFLDLTITLNDDNIIDYKTYQKIQSRFQYITPKSFHPYHTFKGMIIGELKRLMRNSSKEAFYLSSRSLFLERLARMGFPRFSVIKIFQQYPWNDEIIPPREKARPLLLTLIIRFTNLPALNKALKDTLRDIYKEFLDYDPDAFNNSFKKPPKYLLVFKVDKNLLKLTTSSGLYPHHKRLLNKLR